jgi:anti-sigma regulatory factor (Ser/Thr protein kinase)
MTAAPGNNGSGKVVLSFSANMRFVRPVRHFISALCNLAGYEEEETESIALVATEILNNSIEHGSSGPQDLIGVELLVTRETFQFEVSDSGRGGPAFASGAIERASQMPDLEQSRGRGLFLIQRYMDELDVQYDPQQGTRLMVSKTRAS